MAEGISYMAGAELPCLLLNVVRSGPGLGTIQPGQCDYYQSVKGGGHGDYRMFVLAPASVQEMSDFVKIGFDMSFKYRTPAMLLSDGVIGQMMEKVELFDPIPRRTEEEIIKECPWATTGKTANRERNIITSLNLDPSVQEKHVEDLAKKYESMKQDIMFENIMTDDAEYLFVAYGSSARICQKAVDLARAEGIKVGLHRPITLYPFPEAELNRLGSQVKGMLSVEMSLGQLVEDVRLAVNGKTKVEHYGRVGGMIHSPSQVVDALKKQIIGG